MAGWTCPRCERSFGRRNQSHECAPALQLDEYFESRPAWERPIFEAVRDHLEMVGDVTVEAVDVGIFFKRSRTFAELRPKRARLELSVLLSEQLHHPRFRKVYRGSVRSAYFIDLRAPEDVDEDVRDWLTASYLASPT